MSSLLEVAPFVCRHGIKTYPEDSFTVEDFAKQYGLRSTKAYEELKRLVKADILHYVGSGNQPRHYWLKEQVAKKAKA